MTALRLWRDWNGAGPITRDIETAIYAAAIVVAALVVLLVFTREELVIADGVLTRRNLLGIPTRYALDVIGGLARRDVDFFPVPRPTEYVVVYDKQKRSLFKMNRVIWDPADVRRLHAILGGEGRTRRVTMFDLAEEFPGSMPRLLYHPWILLAVELAVILVVILGIVALQDALAHG